MYKQIWEKYFPIIKILIKKDDSQTLDLNQIDFESLGITKSNIRFKIKFEDGRVSNILHDKPIAVELAHMLLDDEDAYNIINSRDMTLSLNTKYQLKIDMVEVNAGE